MASFLARTAGPGSNPPVVNAKTAQTVPDGSVTTSKLSGAGSMPGQALIATGQGVLTGLIAANGTIAVGTGFTVAHTAGSRSYTISRPVGTFPSVALPLAQTYSSNLQISGWVAPGNGSGSMTIVPNGGEAQFCFTIVEVR